MFSSRFVHVVAAAAVVALLNACGQSQPVATAPAGGFALTGAIARNSGLAGLHLNHRKSWFRPGAKTLWLLYASDEETGTIDIYNYRSVPGKLYGQITGLQAPLGECTDAAGDVYVVDYRSAQIYEYAHGGTTPIATATDADGHPTGCSVDPTTGNVAITNFFNGPSGAGDVLVFAGGLSGTQTEYTSTTFAVLYPASYDTSGDLFLEAESQSFEPEFAELPAGGSGFAFLTGLTINRPGGVFWDGTNIAAVDQNYEGTNVTAIYRLTISSSTVTVIGTTVLTDDCAASEDYMDTLQPFITSMGGKQVTAVAGNLDCSQRLGFWNYKIGGNPKRVLPTAIAPELPAGESVSKPSGS